MYIFLIVMFHYIRNKKMSLMDVLSILSEFPAKGHILDVCATCHADATCDDKPDGPGKVCNCKYGFVGNGRTFCQDKDECQIGASKICGQHTTCHNTYGSYYCTCLAGFSPSNNLTVFIPNDGTHCQDDDECRIAGVCGEGARCRNLEGSFDCSCQLGYQVHNGLEPFNPHSDNASCREVDCGPPPPLPHSHTVWSQSSRMGTEVVYQCNSGFHNVGTGDVSTCTSAGQWEGPSMLCQEIVCGSPPIIESTEQVWDGHSTPGSTVLYVCKEGFYYKDGLNISMCNENGQWTPPTLTCQGEDLRATITLFTYLTEIKPPVNHLSVLNEKCLRWRAAKYEEDKEVYQVTYEGSREYQRSFHDRGKQRLSSTADQLELCLNLLPVTNYSISITALSSRFTATISTNTSLTGTPAPPEFETPVPTLRLRRSPDTLDPISLYQVFVLPVEGIVMFDCSSPASSDISRKIKSSAEYITAQIDVGHLGREMNFTVGDGLYYGGFFNAPLQNGRNYYVIVRAVSQWKSVGPNSI
uniref:Sushi domain containing 1 n=1 Tax=Gasterosteus aculeatus aculeatus TaxID=481459 RepID=G3PJ58_GASAC